MPEVLILRHGKSEWPEGVNDRERPLSDRGKFDSERIGSFLRWQGLLPQVILCSPALRARETAERCAKAAGLTTAAIAITESIYSGSAADLIAIIKKYEGNARVMLVGHNPTLDDVLFRLLGDEVEEDNEGKILGTANLAIFNHSTESSILNKIVRPKNLPTKFHYLTAEGFEWRDRPQYCYRQSATVPYRTTEGETEYLLISRTGKDKWSLPRGIVEPGLSPSHAAEKIAMVEVGISGTVGQRAIDTYKAKKWGAKINVEVFPLLVEKEFPNDDWLKQHKRTRAWFSATEVAKLNIAADVAAAIFRLEGMLKKNSDLL